jgi:hypothetical protein
MNIKEYGWTKKLGMTSAEKMRTLSARNVARRKLINVSP